MPWWDRNERQNKPKAAWAPQENAPLPEAEGEAVGFRNTGAVRERAALQQPQLATQTTEMGEPRSWMGGAGAPAPIAVTRGMTTTYQPTLKGPGGQFSEPEYATPLQAGQAWHRGMAGMEQAEADRRGYTDPRIAQRHGQWYAPTQTLMEATQAAQAKTPVYQAQAGALTEKTVEAQAAAKKQQEQDIRTNFDKYVKRRYGGFDNKGQRTAPTEEHILRDSDFASDFAVEKGSHEAGSQYMQASAYLRNMHPDIYSKAMKENPMDWDIYVRGMMSRVPKVTSPTTPYQPPGLLGKWFSKGEENLPSDVPVAP